MHDLELVSKLGMLPLALGFGILLVMPIVAAFSRRLSDTGRSVALGIAGFAGESMLTFFALTPLGFPARLAGIASPSLGYSLFLVLTIAFGATLVLLPPRWLFAIVSRLGQFGSAHAAGLPQPDSATVTSEAWRSIMVWGLRGLGVFYVAWGAALGLLKIST